MDAPARLGAVAGRWKLTGETMGILLAFAPFLVFAVVERLAGGLYGLMAGAAVSLALLARDGLTPGRTPKVLEIGTAILFGGLAILAVVGGSAWSILGVRLRVDAGLLLIVLASMALRRPFTLQYAREQTPPEVWESPAFARTNYVITGVWALAFLALVLADLLMLYDPAVPRKFGILATVAAVIGAVKFTQWYPTRSSVAGPLRPGDRPAS